MGSRRGRACGALLAIACGGTMLAAAPAAAESPLPHSRAPKILSPAAASIVHGEDLRVAVRVRKVRGTEFEASLDGKDITARFGPRRRGVRRAKLTGLEPGEQRLVVRLAGSATSARATGLLTDATTVFVAAERRRSLLSVGKPRPRRGPFRVKPRKPFHQETGDKRAIGLVRAKVNGQIARGAAGANADVGRPEAFRISSSYGIRHGRNVVQIQAVRADGSFDRRRRVIELPRDRPIAGAGRDREAAAGHTAKLDGTDSRRSKRGARKLAYRWEIVSGPKGAKPRLLGGGPNPRIKMPEPGRYSVALRVRQRVGGRVVSSSNTDLVTVTAGASSTAAGLPFETMAFDGESGNLAVRVGDDLYDYPTYNDGSGPQVLGYTVMAFDSETLEQTYELIPKFNVAGPCISQHCELTILEALSEPGGTVSASDWLSIPRRQLGPSGLVNWIAAKALENGRPQIVVVVGDKLKDWISTNAFPGESNFDPASLKVIGGPSGGLLVPGGGENTFSFVGVTYSPSDTGWWNSTSTSLEGSTIPGFSGVGNIAGNLAPGSAGLFTFVSQDAVQIDTNVTGTSNPAAGTTVTIDTAAEGENQYTGQCENGSSGVLALALDGGTAELLTDVPGSGDTFCFNGNPTNEGNLDKLKRFGQFLDASADPGNLIVVQSVGEIYVLGPDNFPWGQVAYKLEQYGGLEARDAFNRVDGGFTFVGGVGVEPQLYWSNQSGYASAVKATRLKGMLVRGNNGILNAEQAQSVPDLAAAGKQPNDPGYLVDYALQEQMYAPPVQWPGTFAQQAAIQWISKAAEFNKASDPIYGGAWTYDVRNYYDISTYNLRATLNGLKPKFKCPTAETKLPKGFGPLTGTKFAPADCKWALAQLKRESDFVVAIWDMVGSLEKPLYQSETSTDLMFSVIAQTVSNAVTETDLQATYNVQDFLGGALGIVGSMFDLFGPEGSLIGPVLGLISGAVYTADQFGTDSNGVPSLDQVSADIGQLASQVDQQFTDAVDNFETIGDVLVSDWAKLETVGQAVNSAQPAYTVPGGSQGESALTNIQDLMIDGFKQEMITSVAAGFTPYAWRLPQFTWSIPDPANPSIEQTPTVLDDNVLNYACGQVGDLDFLPTIFRNLTPGMAWQAELFRTVDTALGPSPTYQVQGLINFAEPSVTIDQSDVVQLPDALTDDLYNAPDGSVGTLNAGMTAASFQSQDAFQLIPADRVAAGCKYDFEPPG